jgi:hypothetical protein
MAMFLTDPVFLRSFRKFRRVNCLQNQPMHRQEATSVRQRSRF